MKWTTSPDQSQTVRNRQLLIIKRECSVLLYSPIKTVAEMMGHLFGEMSKPAQTNVQKLYTDQREAVS